MAQVEDSCFLDSSDLNLRLDVPGKHEVHTSRCVLLNALNARLRVTWAVDRPLFTVCPHTVIYFIALFSRCIWVTLI